MLPTAVKQSVNNTESRACELVNRDYVPIVEPEPYRRIELARCYLNLAQNRVWFWGAHCELIVQQIFNHVIAPLFVQSVFLNPRHSNHFRRV